MFRKNGYSIVVTIVALMIVNMLLGMLDFFMKFKDFSTTIVGVITFLRDISTLFVSAERLIVCLIALLIYVLAFVFYVCYNNFAKYICKEII